MPMAPWLHSSSRNSTSASRSATPLATPWSAISGLSVLDRWVVPQVAIIDRKGNIVAQSAATGTPELQDEAFLRNFLDKLVKEGGATGSAAPAAKAAAEDSGQEHQLSSVEIARGWRDYLRAAIASAIFLP